MTAGERVGYLFCFKSENAGVMDKIRSDVLNYMRLKSLVSLKMLKH